MTKVLKKYTLIPPELYVKRNADKQLKSIIDEMERPGYVLVARQMGKTNLLLNAKREMENENRLFAYIDLSNSFDKERDCYRNIIDLIVEPNDEILGEIKSDIDNQRLLNFPPHKEYLTSLRIILNGLNGDLIIILDEIDALRNSDYSDHIFAQIRSNYFARTNFPELKRVTYVLSGVIEPSNLIKDRNKSPFNIGEKIYLDDFSFEEHLEFIKRSKLTLSTNLSNKVYYWANGNPRLTFDICSAIEDEIIKSDAFNEEQLENLIKQRYLTSYDIAPIDHIRELVSKNSKIRSAVLSLQFGETNISDETKRILYLYGIINSKFDNNSIKIKNPIVKESLSVEWIKSIELESKSLFDIGLQYIQSEIQYLEGISLLNEYLDSNVNISITEKELALYYIGYAYHKLRKFEESNRYLRKQIISLDTSPDMHYRQKCFIGLNHFSLNEFNKGKTLLEEVIENYKKGYSYATSLLNLAMRLMENDFDQNHEKAAHLLDQLIDCIDIIELDTTNASQDRNEFKTLAYYYKFRIALFKNEIENCLEYISSAIDIAEPIHLPELYYLKKLISKEKNLSEKIVRSIIDKNLVFGKTKKDPLCFIETNNYKYLLYLYEEDEPLLFDELLKHTKERLNKNTITENELLYELASMANNSNTARGILKQIIQKEAKIEDEKFLLSIYRDLSLNTYDNPNEFEPYFDEYKLLFSKSEDKLEFSDISSFSYAIKYYSEKNEIDTALNLCWLIENKFEGLSKELRYESLIIYYWLANLYFEKKDKVNSISYADKTLKLINNSKKKRTSTIDEKGITTIVEQVNYIKYALTERKPIRNTKKYKRNEKVTVKYKDGTIQKDIKYKKIESDLLSEECKII